ncbi:MAG: hypothetical protein IKP66_07860, partial [Lachnospiraceae bacterium]|nr:hypothetical protein [Lachnospiraceae bacterium]
DLVGWSYYGYDPKSSMSEKYADGIFKIDIGDEKERYYGFDSKGYMVYGFNNFYGSTYLFNEDPKSIDYGSLIFNNVIMNGKEYVIHHDYGELIGVSDKVGEIYAASQAAPSVIDGHWSGSWRIDPITASRTYILSDGDREIPVNGSVSLGGLYYVFDREGVMQTGFIKYRGNYYYLQEEGPMMGTVYLGYKELGGAKLLFDPILGGRLVNEEVLSQVQGIEPKVISEVPGLS